MQYVTGCKRQLHLMVNEIAKIAGWVGRVGVLPKREQIPQLIHVVSPPYVYMYRYQGTGDHCHVQSYCPSDHY